MNSKQLFSFEDLSVKDKAARAVMQLFNKAGATVVTQDIDTKIKRSSGISFREMMLTFADSQTVTLKIKQTGDIFQVLLNNRIIPIKNQDDHKKALTEIINVLDSGRSKFQAALAKAQVKLPLAIKTAAPTMIAKLTEKRDGLKEAIAMVNSEIETLAA